MNAPTSTVPASQILDNVDIQRRSKSRLGWAIADSWTVTQRDLIHWIRSPGPIVSGLAFPAIMVLLFGFVFGSSMSVAGGDYRQYLMPGLFAMTMAMGVGETMSAMNADANRGITDRFRSMPMSPSAVVAGRSMADLFNSVLHLVILIGCGLLVGWRAEGSFGQTMAAVCLLLLLRFAMLWVGIYLGLVIKSPETVSGVYGLLFPIAIVSNTFADPGQMPAWLGVIAEWNPLSFTVTALRELFGNPVGVGGSWIVQNALFMATVVPLVLTVVFFLLSVRAYRRLSR